MSKQRLDLGLGISKLILMKKIISITFKNKTYYKKDYTYPRAIQEFYREIQLNKKYITYIHFENIELFFKDDVGDKRKFHNLYGYSIKSEMREVYCIDDEQYSIEDWKQKVKYILRNKKFKILLNEQEEIYSRKEEVY